MRVKFCRTKESVVPMARWKAKLMLLTKKVIKFHYLTCEFHWIHQQGPARKTDLGWICPVDSRAKGQSCVGVGQHPQDFSRVPYFLVVIDLFSMSRFSGFSFVLSVFGRRSYKSAALGTLNRTSAHCIYIGMRRISKVISGRSCGNIWA
jgi:hypothetical protein